MSAEVALARELDAARGHRALEGTPCLLMKLQHMLPHIPLISESARADRTRERTLSFMHNSNVLRFVEQLSERLVAKVAFVRFRF